MEPRLKWNKIIYFPHPAVCPVVVCSSSGGGLRFSDLPLVSLRPCDQNCWSKVLRCSKTHHAFGGWVHNALLLRQNGESNVATVLRCYRYI